MQMEEREVQEERFRNPPAEYRGMPFWAWNTKLDPEVFPWQIEQFARMGMGGFHIHTRVGLDTEYLGRSYMDCVKNSVKLAKEKGLYCCLYDEDRWPSGYGGGYVTQEEAFRCRYLLVTPYKKGTKEYRDRTYDSRAASTPQGNGTFLAAYQITLNKQGELASYERCEEETREESLEIGESYKGERTRWYVYLETAYESPWFNNQTYVDTLNPKAIQRFIETTYEAYNRETGEEFGKTIPSIFTDEPQFVGKGFLSSAWAKEEVLLPYTTDLNETFQEAYGADLLDHLPELLWELPDEKRSKYRYAYHDHVTERFARAYGDQIGTWCKNHGIQLCGHMMEEPTLHSQTQALGEVMRSMRSFAIPGVDMLCDAREYTTVKQAASLCHQYGRTGVASELYGVTNWDYDFRRHKLQGDWQAALGVTHRVHHLNWMSMAGEAKRDYPAAIGFQSPWYEQYGQIEDHFARVNTILQSGRPLIRIGVIHPVESYWLYYGPSEQTGEQRAQLEQNFQNITRWLLFQNMDYDYIAESLVAELWDGEQLGKMNYDAIVVPGCVTLRSSTLEMLSEWNKQGRQVIILGQIPAYVDGVESVRVRTWAAANQNVCVIPFTEQDLMRELSAYRLIDIRYHGEKHLKKPNHKKNWGGERTQKYLCQFRQEGADRWLFLANGLSLANPDLVQADHLCIRLKGTWNLSIWDTRTGEKQEAASWLEEGWTCFYITMYDQDSLLLHMEAKENRGEEIEGMRRVEKQIGSCHNNATDREITEWKMKQPIDQTTKYNNIINYKTMEWKRDLTWEPVAVCRNEPNVLLLDMPEYSLDQGPWQPQEEILRIDNQFRKQLGYPLRMAAFAQPWTRKGEPEEAHLLALRYQINCLNPMDQIQFAMEGMDETALFLDGHVIKIKDCGFYVDPCIRKTLLPDMEMGVHQLELQITYKQSCNPEACYLLGDFDVEVRGRNCFLKTIDSPAFYGSLNEQGMPFYGGNADYVTELCLEEGDYQLSVTKFRAPLLLVYLDDTCLGSIEQSPYALSFSIPVEGTYRLTIRSFGSRVNTFGAVHNCDEQEIYFDPNAFRTEGDSWAYEYQLKRTGILKAPILSKLARKDEKK